MAKTFIITEEQYSLGNPKSFPPYNRDTDLGMTLTLPLLKQFLKAIKLHLYYYRPDTTVVLCKSLLSKQVITPSKRLPAYPVDVINWSGQSIHKYTYLVSQILSPVIKGKIIFSVPHGTGVEMSPRGAFQVYVWSTPNINRGRTVNTPREMWGRSVSCRDASYGIDPILPSIPIISDEGDVVGQLSNNALYIFHDAVEYSNLDSHIIFARILQQAADLYKTADFANVELDMVKIQKDRNIKAITEFSKNVIRRGSSRNKKLIDTTKEKVKDLEKELYETENLLADMEHSLVPEETQKKFLEEFDDLYKTYSNVTFENSCLTITTDNIIAHNRNTGRDHVLGQVNIKVRFTSDPQVFMLDPTGKMRVPHTGGKELGKVCLGSALSEVRRYIANYEMLTVIGFMIAFLENGVDSGDEWGKYIKYYPTV